jgi:hypothetical protein
MRRNESQNQAEHQDNWAEIEGEGVCFHNSQAQTSKTGFVLHLFSPTDLVSSLDSHPNGEMVEDLI